MSTHECESGLYAINVVYFCQYLHNKTLQRFKKNIA